MNKKSTKSTQPGMHVGLDELPYLNWQVPELPDAPDVLFHLEVFPSHGSRFGVGRDAAMLGPVGILHPDNLFQVVFQVGRLGKSVSHRLKGRDSVSSQDQKVWFMDFKADCRSTEGNA